MLIVFCRECGKRINDAELSSGKAKTIAENQYVCAECAVAVAAVAASPAVPQPARSGQNLRPSSASALPTQAKAQRITKQIPARKTSAGMDAASSRGDLREVREGRGDSRAKPAKNNLVVIGASAGVAVIAILILVFSGGSKPADTAKKSQPDGNDKPATTFVPPAPVASIPSPPPKQVPVEPPRQPVVAPVQPPAHDASNDMEDVRNELAATKLREAKALANATPPDPWTYKEKLEAVASTYRSTPSGKEAQSLLANLKVPEKPAPAPAPANVPPANVQLPAGSGDWKTVIGPQNIEGLNPSCREHWIVVNGALEMKPDVSDAGQSAVDYGDGEFRMRFTAQHSSSLGFFPHQGGEGIAGVHLYRPKLDALDASKEHELIVVCSGDKYKATLDGQTVEVENNGSPRRGRIQFNYREGTVRIFAIDFRPLDKH